MNSLLDTKKKLRFLRRFGLLVYDVVRRMIIENIELLVKSMNGLQVELSGFRAEMKEFKTAVEKRMDCLDNRSTACQFNPNVCATARRLEEHIKADNGKAGRNMAVIACVISCFNVAVTVITLIVKGM